MITEKQHKQIFNTKEALKRKYFVTDKSGEVIFGFGNDMFMLMAFAEKNQRDFNGSRKKLYHRTREELSKTAKWFEETKC